MMTKQNFEAVAKAMVGTREFFANTALDGECTEILNFLSADLADVFKADNPNFKPETFFKAAGVK